MSSDHTGGPRRHGVRRPGPADRRGNPDLKLLAGTPLEGMVPVDSTLRYEGSPPRKEAALPGALFDRRLVHAWLDITMDALEGCETVRLPMKEWEAAPEELRRAAFLASGLRQALLDTVDKLIESAVDLPDGFDAKEAGIVAACVVAGVDRDDVEDLIDVPGVGFALVMKDGTQGEPRHWPSEG